MCQRASLVPVIAPTFALAGLAAISAGAWPQVRLLALHRVFAAAMGAAAVYVAAGAFRVAFEPPTPQRSAAHAIVLSSYAWLAVLASGLAECATGNDAGRLRGSWLALTTAAWFTGALLVAYALLRMYMVDRAARNAAALLQQQRRRRRAGGAQATQMPSLYELAPGATPMLRSQARTIVDSSSDDDDDDDGSESEEISKAAGSRRAV